MGDERARELADELRLLRARAYGPGADIDSDPQALARLGILEQQRGSVEPPTSPASAAPPSDDSRPIAPPTAEPADAPPTDSQRPDAQPPDATSWWRRHGWAVPLITAAAAAALSVAVTVALLSLQRAPALVLEQDETAHWPEEDFGQRPEGALLFDDALGLKVITQPRGWGTGDGTQVCLLINYGRLFTGGCAAEPYLPTASLALTDELPDELHARFPQASALQFVLDGGRVLVYDSRR